MQTTPLSDVETQKSDAPEFRLRVEVYDALAAARGRRTVVSQADLHGVHRSTMFCIRSGKKSPRLALAMRIAEDLGTTVDALFERAAS